MKRARRVEWEQKFFENPRTKAFVIKRPKIQQVHSYSHISRGTRVTTDRHPACLPLCNLIVELDGHYLKLRERTNTRFG